MIKTISVQVILLCIFFTPTKHLLSEHCLGKKTFDETFKEELQGKSLRNLVKESEVYLGKGSFGVVKEINLKIKGVIVPVAVKLIAIDRPVIVKPVQREIDFLVRMKGSEHVPNFYGCMEIYNINLLLKFPIRTHVIVLVTEKLYSDFGNENTRKKFQTDPKVDGLETYLSMAKAIKYLQANKIVHSDLKPANVMALDEGLMKVKLVDFGLAVNLDSPWIGGSDENIPFETSANEVKSNKVMDVYGFGTTVAAMEFSPKELKDAALNQISSKITSNKSIAYARGAASLISKLHKYDVPNYKGSSFVEIINACLSKEPAYRPTIDQVIEKLEKLKEARQQKNGLLFLI